MAVPSKVQDRVVAGVKKFMPVLNSARTKDVNESDTVVIVTDILSEIFGYDKYHEVTSEYAIRNTYCDLAIKIDGKVKLLIEVKAIGLDLKDDHVKQAIDYGANEGIEWVILTNGQKWQIFRVGFTKPISKELIYEINFLNLNLKSESTIEQIYYICREALSKSLLEEFHLQKQALSKYTVGQLMLTEPILDSIKRELKKISPGIKIENDEILTVLQIDVLKRDVLEGDKALEAKKKIAKAQNQAQKQALTKKTTGETNSTKQISEEPPKSDSEETITKVE